MQQEHFQKEKLLSLARNGGFSFTEKWFPYTSGCIGPYYVQSVDVCKTGSAYQTAIHGVLTVVEQIVRDSNQAIEVISGGESRDWPFSFPIAERLGVGHLMMYKDGKSLGPDIQGKRVLHIADLNNEGSSPRDKWIPIIRNAGGIITDIIFFVDRLEDGVQVMKDLNLNSHAVVPLNKRAWRILWEEDIINFPCYESLEDYWRDRKSWGMKKLIEYPEILLEILVKDKTKGMKIYKTYFPFLGESLPKALGFDSHKTFTMIYY